VRVIQDVAYETRRSRRLGVGIVVASAAAAGVLALSQPDQTMWLGAVLAVSTLLGVHRLVPSFARGMGRRRERSVLERLQELSDDYSVRTDWSVPGVAKGEVDAVVFGPHGVLLLELRTLEPDVVCEGDKWFAVRSDGTRRLLRSLSNQLRDNRKSVERYLRRQGIAVPVLEAMIVSDRSGELRGATAPVVRDYEIAAYVHGLPSAEAASAREATRILSNAPRT